MDGDVMTDDEIKSEIEHVMALVGHNIEIVRLKQDHDIDTDATKVRVEITFELR